MEITNELIEKVDSALREHGVYAEVYKDSVIPVMTIAIHWGDWKHEHLCARWVVEDVLGLKVAFWNTIVTEEDGSDCYSAEHKILFE